MTDINRLQQLLDQLEAVRTRLQNALKQADGNQQDSMVQSIADEFDLLLNEYNKERYNQINT